MIDKTASEALVAFSNGQPLWQRDALRRLATKAILEDSDIEELLLLLKSQNRIPLPGGKAAPATCPLELHHLEGSGDARLDVRLRQLSNVRNVNRLAPDQLLEFGKGITLLYGDNGSGKSGYVRLLKRACAARGHEREAILADVFDADYASKPPGSVDITVAVVDGNGNETETPFSWSVDQAPPAEMRRLRVFDTKVAAISVNEDNEIAFSPFNLDLLDRLAEVCEKLSQKIKTQKQTVEMYLSKIPEQIPEVGKARDFVRRIDFDTPTNIIDRETSFVDENKKRLRELSQILRDTEKDLANTRQFSLSITALIEKMKKISRALDLEAINFYTRIIKDFSDLGKALHQLRSNTFDKSLIDGIGEEAWRQLWSAARDFSSSFAYPDKPFPVTACEGDQALCVLCHQPLARDAVDRLKLFDQFVEGEIARKYDAAKLQLGTQASNLGDLVPELSTQEKSVGAQADTWDDGISDGIFAWFTEAAKSYRQVVDSFESCRPPPSGVALPVSPAIERLERLTDVVNLRIETMEAALDPVKRETLDKELLELRQREVLSQKKEVILEFQRYRQIDRGLTIALDMTDTRPISDQKRKLDEKFVSQPFNKALNDEKNRLGVSHAVQLGFKRKKSKTLHRPTIQGTTHPQIWDILSEGEHRALALACFLAEARMISDDLPLIIDDPVSSLDHRHIESVAKRLAEVGATGRQIIVFTHSYVFASELIDKSAELNAPLRTHWIRENEDLGWGVVDTDNAPWQIMNTKKRIADLTQRLDAAKTRPVPDKKGYRSWVKSYYTDMRETWERAVEEILFGDVVKRFEAGVETQKLRYSYVDNDDFRTVYWGMKRCSRYSGHDPAVARQTSLPTMDDIESDLGKLKNYAEKILKRQKEIEKDRKNTIRPAK